METFYEIIVTSGVAAGTGFMVTYFLVPIFLWLAPKLKLVDRSGASLSDGSPVPRGGGITLIIALQCVFFITALSPWYDASSFIDLTWWTSFSLASFVVGIYGLLDDHGDIDPIAKLSGQIIAALILFSADVRFATAFSYSLPVGLDLIATLLWFIIIVNAFNLIDGIDGLASGLAVIASLGVAGGLMPRGMYFEAFLMLGFSGACFAFLRFNRFPAVVHLGDTGSNFIGFILATMTLQTGSKTSGLAYFCIPLFTLAIPVADTLLAIWRRAGRKCLALLFDTEPSSGILAGDREHLHHRLRAGGISDRDVTASLCLFNAVLVLLGLLMVPWRDGQLLLLVVALMVGGYLLIRVCKIHELEITKVLFIHTLADPRKYIIALPLYLLFDLLALSVALLVQIQVVHRDLSGAVVVSEFLTLLPSWIAFGLTFIVIIEMAQNEKLLSRKLLSVLVILYFLSVTWFSSTITMLAAEKRIATVLIQLCLFFALGFVFTSIPRIIVAFGDITSKKSGKRKRVRSRPFSDYQLYSRLLSSKK